VADTSTVINLIATGCAPAIIRALPDRLVAVDIVAAEIELGRARGRKDADRLKELAAAGFVEIAALSEVGLRHFEELVIGPAASTLDDSEAATIAYAVQEAGSALIDERKAVRIGAERFPKLGIASTVDILFHPGVREGIGAETLARAVWNALQVGRMSVLPHQVGLVVQLIGLERAAECQSLPRAARPAQSQP